MTALKFWFDCVKLAEATSYARLKKLTNDIRPFCTKNFDSPHSLVPSILVQKNYARKISRTHQRPKNVTKIKKTDSFKIGTKRKIAETRNSNNKIHRWLVRTGVKKKKINNVESLRQDSCRTTARGDLRHRKHP